MILSAIPFLWVYSLGGLEGGLRGGRLQFLGGSKRGYKGGSTVFRGCKGGLYSF